MIIVFQPSRAALSPVVFQNPAQLNSRDHGKQGARRRLQTEMLQECNTRGQYTSVLITFERVDEALPPPAVGWLGVEVHRSIRCQGRADMPAFIQHHQGENAPIICPGCVGLLPMYVREVEPHWSMAKIDFIYECSDCGAEVRQTITRPEQRH
jgi:hypothetical protein